MAGILTHAAVVLMARERIGRIIDTLAARERSGAALTPVETRVRRVAESARAFLNVAPFPSAASLPRRPFALPLGEEVSTFALLGAVGPAIPAFGALLTPYQDWVARVAHAGNADPNREPAAAKTTDFALRFWDAAQAAITSGVAAGEQERERQRMRAYVLGHLCHVATDVVCGPYLEALRWADRPKAAPRFTEDGVAALRSEAHLDGVVAQRVLMRGSTREGEHWSHWWPPVGDVKDYFFAAYHSTLERTYQTASVPPTGFGDFEDRYDAFPRPAESAAFLRGGYRTFRDWAVPLAYDHGVPGFWLWATFPLAVPLLVAPPLMLALREGRKRLTPQRPGDRDPALDAAYDAARNAERAWWELLSLPLALTAAAPLALGFLVFNPLTTHEGGAYFWLSSVLSLGAAVAGGVALGVAAGGGAADGWARWLLLFGLPLAPLVAHLVFLVRDGAVAERRVHKLLPLIFFSPLFVALLYVVMHLVIQLLFGEVIGGGDVGDAGRAGFWVTYGVWVVLGVVFWLVLAFSLRDYLVPDAPAAEFLTKQGRFVRLFDDATLYRLPNHPEAAYFPSGRRKLLKLWWEGPGDLYVRSDRTQLAFSFTPEGATPQTVPGPIAPMTAQEFGAFLTRVVKNGGGTASAQLKWALADPRDRDIDYELPPGAVFSDHGDADDTPAGRHAALAATFVKLGTTQEGSDYFLYHAPKREQTVQWARTGPVVVDQSRAAETAGRAGAQASVAAASPGTVTGVNSDFLSFFRPGDVIRLGASARVVLEVIDDVTLTTVLPFPAAVAGVAYARAAVERAADVAGPGTVASPGGDAPRVGFILNGTDTHFGEFFAPGDAIRPLFGDASQVRTVHTVVSDALLTVDVPFDPAVPAGTAYERLGAESRDGYRLVPNGPDDAFPEESLMDYAADMATLLCLGATPHLMTPAERSAAGTIGGGAATPIAKAYQVFRNWNLDRRRVNEWQMLVAGRAVSEKRGAPAGRDPAMLDVTPFVPSLTPEGERTATRAGWVPVLRKWLDMQGRFGELTTSAGTRRRPEDPSNHELTQAMAFLLELAAPAATP